MKKLLIALAIACCLATQAQAESLRFNFSSIPGSGGSGSKMRFDGTDGVGSTGTFTFLNATNGFDFQIDNTNGALFALGGGDASGLFGNFGSEGATYTIGTLSSVNIFGTTLYTATVSGSHQFSITDGSGFLLTGDLTLKSISGYGVGGIVNVAGELNLTSISYPVGTNVDLGLLAAYGSGTLTMTFEIPIGQSLAVLTSNGTHDVDSYSGQIAAVPEPASMAMLTIGGLLAGAYGVRRRKN